MMKTSHFQNKHTLNHPNHIQCFLSMRIAGGVNVSLDIVISTHYRDVFKFSIRIKPE